MRGHDAVSQTESRAEFSQGFSHLAISGSPASNRAMGRRSMHVQATAATPVMCHANVTPLRVRSALHSCRELRAIWP
jgi:hypothetical protein